MKLVCGESLVTVEGCGEKLGLLDVVSGQRAYVVWEYDQENGPMGGSWHSLSDLTPVE